MPTNAKKAFVFFNCDENKSEQSMNIFYNRVVYRDLTTARRLLWKKITDELEGDPTAASEFIKFGAIKEIDCC